MTGTALTEKEEFESIYNLKVSPIPSNKPCQRIDEDDEVYTTDAGKWTAVVRNVQAAFESQRPVLVGTTSIENSELLAKHLDAEGVPYYLLNAKPENASREAEIIAAGGRLGAVTISTNMAGRGTDIVLGGDAKSMAKLHLQAALTEALGGQEAVSLALCLALPEDVSKEMSKAAKVMAQFAPAVEAVMAAVCDGIADPSQKSMEYHNSLKSLQEVYSKACQVLSVYCEEEGLKASGTLMKFGYFVGEYLIIEVDRLIALDLHGCLKKPYTNGVPRMYSAWMCMVYQCISYHLTNYIDYYIVDITVVTS